MAPEQRELLTLKTLPARLTAAQAAHILGFQATDIPILVEAELLRPLGHPPASSCKYYAAAVVEALHRDERWLARATDAIHRYWKRKNLAKRNSAQNGSSDHPIE